MLSEFFKWEGSVAFVTVGTIIFFIIFFTFVIRNDLKEYRRSKEGPFAEATITNVKKVRDKQSSEIRYENMCDITYTTQDGSEYQSVLFLPYDYVPVGGQVRIAYNPKKPNKVVFSRATFMESPEYIAQMEEKGFTFTGDSFIRKTHDTGAITMKQNDIQD